MCAGDTDLLSMGRLLINCDLGENESDAQTELLLRQIDLANICCGVHAGSRSKTRRTLVRAADKALKIGVHPGLPAAGGRGAALPRPEDFYALLTDQVGDFCAMAGGLGVEVDCIKLHGSLYHAVEQDQGYASVYQEFLQAFPKKLAVLSLAGGELSKKLMAAGVEVWPEGFVDRAYHRNGRLVARSQIGAILQPDAAEKRFRRWQACGAMDTVYGKPIPLQAATFCVHADSPDALAMLSRLQAGRRR